MNRNGMNLVELAKEIMRRAESKKDFVADTTDMIFEGGALSVGSAGAFPLTDHAHGQIAERVGIPKRYYDRMRADAPALLAGNVNHWFRATPERWCPAASPIPSFTSKPSFPAWRANPAMAALAGV